MDNAPPATRHAFLARLGLADEAARSGVVSATRDATDRTWQVWLDFCAELHVDPLLQTVDDPIAVLQVYADQVRDGTSSRSGQPVRSATVDSALRDVGQTCALLGAADPRLNRMGKLDLRLSRQLRCYRRSEPPPTRVKPIPIDLLQLAVATTRADPSATPLLHACSDMTIVAFYFLMRSGEYAVANADSHPFRWADVELFVGRHRLSTLEATERDLLSSTFVLLTFTTQKNGTRGDKIGHARSGHDHFCPVLALVRRILHLRTNHAPITTPINTYFTRRTPHTLTTRAMTAFLRRFVVSHGRAHGLRPQDVEARSLRSSGAMALLCARVDADVIQLVGRWKSDTMLRYLHVQAPPLMSPLAAAMMRGGTFSFHALSTPP